MAGNGKQRAIEGESCTAYSNFFSMWFPDSSGAGRGRHAVRDTTVTARYLTRTLSGGALKLLVLILSISCYTTDAAAGGPLGIDRKLTLHDGGIWDRQNQQALLFAVVGTGMAGALWEGGETRLGRTFWQSIDAFAMGAISSEALIYAFTRSRPWQTDDPGRWFQGGGNYSFPSAEVTSITAVITPFVLEYGPDHPAVYALELLPLYDAIARVKVQGHWQTDVLAAFALGTAAGYLAHTQRSPIILSILPQGFAVGLKMKF